MTTPTFTLVINAGGQSRRMGQPKALLPMPPHNTPLLRHIWERLQPLTTTPAIVVANDQALVRAAGMLTQCANMEVLITSDRYPHVGALGGIATGVSLCKEWAILVACDMPLLNPTLLQWMQTVASESTEWDAIVPVVNGYAEPFHALYHHRCLPAIEACIAAGERRASSFLDGVRTRFLPEAMLRCYDPLLHSFFNVNRPEEWEAALSMMRATIA